MYVIYDFRLLPRCIRDIRSSGILRSVGWHFSADVSVQYIGPIFKSQLVFDFLTLKDMNDRLSRNVCKELPRYSSNILEELGILRYSYHFPTFA